MTLVPCILTCPHCGGVHTGYGYHHLTARDSAEELIRRCHAEAVHRLENEDTQELPRTTTHSASLGRNQEA